MRRLIISPSAKTDFRHIGDFIAKDNPKAARLFVQRLKRRCNELLPFPNVGRRRNELGQGCRSVTEGDYIIFYRLRADDALEVMRIMHSKQDISKIKFAEPES